VNKHGRIVFNGNNYAEEWVKEAAKRGLPNVRNTVDALKAFTTPKALALFAKYKVLSHEEMHSRYEIYLEQYAKHINIEARTASQMVRRQFLPAAMLYMTELGNSVKAAGAAARVQKALLGEIGALVVSADKNVKLVEKEAGKAHDAGAPSASPPPSATRSSRPCGRCAPTSTRSSASARRISGRSRRTPTCSSSSSPAAARTHRPAPLGPGGFISPATVPPRGPRGSGGPHADTDRKAPRHGQV